MAMNNSANRNCVQFGTNIVYFFGYNNIFTKSAFFRKTPLYFFFTDGPGVTKVTKLEILYPFEDWE